MSFISGKKSEVGEVGEVPVTMHETDFEKTKMLWVVGTSGTSGTSENRYNPPQVWDSSGECRFKHFGGLRPAEKFPPWRHMRLASHDFLREVHRYWPTAKIVSQKLH